jgi:hypothetical protein
MIDALSVILVFVAVVVAALVVSVRLGMLLGMRLDRAMEVRAAADGRHAMEESIPAPSPGAHDRSPDPGNGREEDRGE